MYSEKEKRRKSGGHNLAFKMWACKGARFVADERCKNTAKLSSFTLAFLSFEVIAISIYSLTGNLNNVLENKTISALTLILSILFLVLSIFENAKEYSVKAKEFHNCGLEIGKVYSKLKLILAKNKDEDYNDEKILDEISKEYEVILEKYENHEEIDYKQFRINKKKDFKVGNWEKIKNVFSIYFRSQFLYHFLILIGPILAIIYLTDIGNSNETQSIKSNSDIDNIELSSENDSINQIKTMHNN